jgi:S1-C subfamily serine protease
MRVLWVAGGATATLLTFGALIQYTVSELPAAIRKPPDAPRAWYPDSVFTIPVPSASGTPIRIDRQPVNLETGGVENYLRGETLRKLWRLAEPATVRVVVRFGGNRGQMGGGAIVSPEGLVLTARHVVNANFQSIEVVWDDGQRRSARVVATDPEHDLALLQINRPESECYPFLRVAGPEYDHLHEIHRGTSAMVMGFGKSALRLRALPATFEYPKLYEDLTWASSGKRPENPIDLVYDFEGNAVEGDSGSPVLDARGVVVGILSAASIPGESSRGFVAGVPYKFKGGLHF